MFRRSRKAAGRMASKMANYGRTLVGEREIREHGGFIREMAEKIASPLRKGKVREETFSNAYLRLGMTEEKLQLAHRHYTVRFYIFYVFGLLGVAILSYNIWAGQWLGIGAATGFLAICAAQLFASSFRLYQIRRRELSDVRAWAAEPGQWLPRPWQNARHANRQEPQGQRRRLEGASRRKDGKRK